MSRWTYDPPDTDQFEAKPIEDVDVPDFDQPDPPVDPAEHAAQAVVSALETFRAELDKVTDVSRALSIKKLTRQLFLLADNTDQMASIKITECCMERRR